MSKQKPYMCDEAAELSATEMAAEYLTAAFVWDATPFPDLSDADGHGDKWLAVYKYLKEISKKAEKNG